MRTSVRLAETFGLAAVLGAVVLSFLFSPAYMRHLRAKLERQAPEEWAKVVNNGSFMYVSPLIVSTRNHEEGIYAMKLRQLALHGLPYDPHTGEKGLRSWFFDSLLFLPLSPFVRAAGGDVQTAWMLARAILGALWVLWLFLAFKRYAGDFKAALACGLLCFFALDCLTWAVYLVVPTLFGASGVGLGQALFLLVARAFGQVQWMRLPTPGMTYLWLYAAHAAACALALSRTRRPWAALAVGLSLGFLAFAHFYEWTYGVGVLCAAALLARVLKLPGEGRFNLALACVPAVLVSLGYYAFARAMTRDIMADIVSTMGSWDVHFTHSSWLYLALALLFAWRARVLSGEKRWIWACLALSEAAVAALQNAQWLLGYNMQFSHFCNMGALSASLALFLLFLDGASRREACSRHAWVLAAAVFAWVFTREKGWADTHYKLFGAPRAVEEAARWLNQNAPPKARLASLSGLMTEFLPLKTDVRYFVGNAVPAFGSPRPSARNVLGLAGLLKELDADQELFFERRWRRYLEADDTKQRRTHFSRNLDWESAQAAAWPYFLFALEPKDSRRREAREREIREAARDAPPLERPFYFWLASDDAPFLRRPPEKLGASLCFANEGVRLYYFPASGAPRACPEAAS